MTEKQWYTTGEAAEILDVSQSWIIRMIEKEEIPCVWFGGRRKININNIMELRENGINTKE